MYLQDYYIKYNEYSSANIIYLVLLSRECIESVYITKRLGYSIVLLKDIIMIKINLLY